MKVFIATIAFTISAFFVQAQSSATWYKVYTGKVGNMNATVHLAKYADNYAGYIWFDQNTIPMFLYGDPNAKSDSISLNAAVGQLSITLAGIIKGDAFAGKSILQKENSNSKSAGFQLKENTSKIFTPLKYIHVNGHAKLPPKSKNESTCEYNSGTVWPTENNTIAQSLKKEIYNAIGLKSTADNPEALMKEKKTGFINAWLKDYSKLPQKEASEMGLSLSVEEDNRLLVMYENENNITLANYNYAFTGGAHGNYATSLLNLDKRTGKKIQLSDVLNANGIKALPLFLDRVARLQYGITNNKSLEENGFFVKKIEPSKEFYVTSAGIGFLYPTYALRSFADGEVNLFVPLTALKSYLQPGFAK